jgi:DNA-binding CsgD family transcriptional regulator
MLTHHHVAAATRVGMLTRERDTAAACGEALCLLGQAIPHDAATLVALDPAGGGHVQLAGVGYSAVTSETLAAEFVGTPWYRTVIEQALPPSISSDAGQFRRGSFYEQYVQPAGHRDGVTGALRRGGRYVGLVHLASAQAGVFDTDTRQLLAAMLPALAALADLTERVRGLGNLPPEASAALAGPDGIVDLPGCDRPPMLGDDEFLGLLAEFARSGGGSLKLVWRVGRDWYRVGLSHQPRAGRAGGDVLLVQALPTRLPYGLSPRELDVLTRLAMGQSNQAIAHGLFVSPRTVHTHIEHILRKCGCSSRAEAAALAMREHLLRPTADGALARFVRH